MQRYEFKVIPAPRRGEKARGLKSTEDRFAFALTQVMNTLGAEGWDYVRADALPCDERAGLTGTKTSFQNMLVFRRPLPMAAPVVAPVVVPVTAGVAQPRGALSAEQAAQSLQPQAAPAFSAVAPLDEGGARLGAAAQPMGSAPSLGSASAESSQN